MKVELQLESEIVDLLLLLVRGLRLSEDLRMAEQAVRAEREIEEALQRATAAEAAPCGQ